MFALEKIIIESDEDLAIVSTIVAGYDYRKNFVVQYTCRDYDRGGEKGYTAIVDEEDAKVMARHLKVGSAELPQALYDEFGDCTGTTTLSGIEYVFKEILDCILDSGVKYKLTSK